jgi:hypothetical protein
MAAPLCARDSYALYGWEHGRSTCGNYLFRSTVDKRTVAHMRNKPPTLMTLAAGFASLSVMPVLAQTGHAQHHPGTEGPGMKTPQSIASEHRELHDILARAAKEGGEVGSRAKELEQALAPHFRREEEIATPPLGLLPQLARGDATAEMRAVLPMTEALERELPQMLREHEAIRRSVQNFRKAAATARREEYVRFSDQLAAHARQEEEILYPAAVLVGRYVARAAPER